MLARGGYATVYQAVQLSVGRDVAVKVENRTLESDRDQRRFLREARAAGRMSSHPHVVDLFDAGVTDDGHPYLIMELCDGSYAERMRNAPLSAAETREVGFKIADALADAHSLGVLHRDVKPANILFSRFGEPALADFGLAILAEWRDVSITLDVLTPAYAPPESFRQSEPSPTGDVYALCATLYALMRGRPPRWREDQPPSMVSLVDLFAEPIPDLPGVPREMMAVLRAGMANDAAGRPTAMELRDLLMALRIDPLPSLSAAPLAVDYLNDDTVPQGPTVPSGPTAPIATAMPAAAAGGPGGPGGPGGSGGAGGVASEGGDGAPAGGWALRGLVPPGNGSPDGSSPDGGWSGAGATNASAGSPYEPWGAGRPPHRRNLVWALVAAGAAALALILVLGVAYASRTGDIYVFKMPIGGPTPSGQPSRSPSTDPSALSTADGTPCGPGVPGSASCITGAECYDSAKKQVACGGRHTWEAFAFADLPAGVATADAAQNAEVRKVCSRFTLLLVDPNTVSAQWRIDVLVPRANNRTYRCLAGKGPNALSGPQLRKSR